MTKQYNKTKRITAKTSRPVVRNQRRLPFGMSRKLATFFGVLFVLLIGAFGTWKVMDSRADTTGLTGKQCLLLGRPYSSSTGVCYSKCSITSDTYVTSQYWGYCAQSLSTGVSSTQCTNLRRVYLFYGCTRRPVRTNLTGAIQCRYSADTYIAVSSGYDYCKAATTTTTSTTTSAWKWPVPAVAAIGSLSWGEYTSRGYHKGIDIGRYDGSALGKYVVAAKSGKVTKSWWDTSCGGMMVIKADGTNYWTGYQHLQNRYVSVGQYVTAGTNIGTVGKYGETTCGGSSSGAFYHLHFSVEKGDWLSYYSSPLSNSVNPCQFYTSPC